MEMEQAIPSLNQPSDAPLFATADAQGAFSLETLEDNRDYHFFVESGDRRSLISLLSLPAHPVTGPLEIKLGKPITVSGKILLHDDGRKTLRIVLEQYLPVQKNGIFCRARSPASG